MGRPLNKQYFGPIAPGGTQIAVEAWVGGDTQSRVGYIIKQNGSERYHVMTNFGEGDCYLVDTITGPEQMTIQVLLNGASPDIQHAKKLTDKEVYVWDLNYSNYYPNWEAVNGQVVYGTRTESTSWVAGYGDIVNDAYVDFAQGVTSDSGGNLIATGGIDATNWEQAYVIKMSPTGETLWQKGFTWADGYGTPAGELVMCDSSNNIYAAMSKHDGLNTTTVVKLDPNGNIVWQRDLTGFGQCQDIAVDSTGNVAIISGANGGGSIVAKYTSNGTLSWQTTIEGNGGNVSTGYGGVAFTTNNHLAVTVAYEDLYYPTYGINITSFDANGSPTWSNSYNYQSSNWYPQSVSIDSDSTGNLYLHTGEVDYNTLVAAGDFLKFTPDGTLQWNRSLRGQSGDYYYPYAVKTAADGTQYVCGVGYDSNVLVGGITLTSRDPNGNLNWQRILSSTVDININYDQTYGGRDVTVHGNRVSFVGHGQTQTTQINDHALIGTLPTDGSNTGVYGVFDYVASTFINDAGTCVASPTAMTFANLGLTDSAGVMVMQDLEYEFDFTNFG